MAYKIHFNKRKISGSVALPASKSISNRMLIIRALVDQPFPINNLSDAKDTCELQEALRQHNDEVMTGDGGTTFRFCMAYYALTSTKTILRAGPQMSSRPIGKLADALNTIGARVNYLEKEGYPPIMIEKGEFSSNKNEIELDTSQSSQFVSAMMMVAPKLPKGLKIRLGNNPASVPYIQMTAKLMTLAGVKVIWDNGLIEIPPGNYNLDTYTVEPDWTSASYFYNLLAIAEEGDLRLKNLSLNSIQGDVICAAIYRQFLISSEEDGNDLLIKRNMGKLAPNFQFHFRDNPDLAMTLAVLCPALGVKGKLQGLCNLRIKESDRILSLQNGFKEMGWKMQHLPGTKADYNCEQTLETKAGINPVINSANDHRIAMSFATLAMIDTLVIRNPGVVKKSFPCFWDRLLELGCSIIPED